MTMDLHDLHKPKHKGEKNIRLWKEGRVVEAALYQFSTISAGPIEDVIVLLICFG